MPDDDSFNDNDAEDRNDDDANSDKSAEDVCEYEVSPFPWHENIYGQVKTKISGDGEPEVVARFDGALIRRSQIRLNFLQAIEEPTEETSAMGFQLFDRYGNLLEKHKNSGSRIWGDEVDQGDILLVETITVDKKYRRKRLATRLCKQIIDAACAKSCAASFVALARTAIINWEMDRNIKGKEWLLAARQQVQASTHFLRSLGFRRVGTTEWFALSGNETHACHKLLAVDDYETPVFDPHEFSEPFDALSEQLKADKENDDACLAMLNAHLQAVGTSDEEWCAPDVSGNTILHFAAEGGKPECVKWLLNRFPELGNARNQLDETALAFCVASMERTRSQLRHGALTVPIADRFAGFESAFVKTVCALQNLENPSEDDLQRIKFGCTCSQCISGFLSPRMRHVLFLTAESLSDMIKQDIEMTEGHGQDFVNGNQELLQFLPAAVCSNLGTNKSMRQGFGKVFVHFATCLREGKAPTDQDLLQAALSARSTEWPPVTKTYLERGGTFSAIGSCIFAWALDTSPLSGDGTVLDGEETGTYDALPKCRNDEDFGFVSSLCGYERVTRNLPPLMEDCMGWVAN